MINAPLWNYVDFCIKCEYDTLNPAGTVIHTSTITDSWSFSLIDDPCALAFTERNPGFHIKFNKESGGSVIINPNGFTDFFDHTNNSCPLDTCELKYSSGSSTECDIPMPSAAGSIDGSFTVTVLLDTAYDETWCYICSSNGFANTAKFKIINRNSI